MSNGPLMLGFTIYKDFMTYSTGIYRNTVSTVLGRHAVKLIGWNVDGSGKLYWICQNQWGVGWGELGYFNIYAGVAGIDALAWACEPDLTNF
jgi:cathepsin B